MRPALALFILGIGISRILFASDFRDAQDHYKKGTAFEGRRDYPSAIPEFQESLDAAPNYFWAYRELGNCFYYLGERNQAISAYKRYLSENPEDKRLNSFLTKYESENNSKSGNSGISGAKKFALGLGAGMSYYSMNSWNNSVNIEAVTSSGDYDNSGTPLTAGIGYYSNFRYQLNPKWDLGFFGDYLTGSGTFADKWVDSSGAYSNSGNYNFSTLFLGPEINYEFWHLSKWRFLAGGGLAYLSLLGANAAYYGQDAPNSGTPSQGNKNSTLSGSGFGGYLAATTEYRVNADFSFLGQVGYRLAEVTNLQQSQAESIEFAGQNQILDYSGIYVALELNYWR